MADPAGVAELIRGLAAGLDAERLRRDVETLAVEPRSRRHAPEAMRWAEAYAVGELRRAGWGVGSSPFDVRTNDTERAWP